VLVTRRDFQEESLVTGKVSGLPFDPALTGGVGAAVRVKECSLKCLERWMSEQSMTAGEVLAGFEMLAASRRDWIQQVLRPWCRTATMRELRKAELEWLDIAGRVDVKATLWTWAWERYPDIVHADMAGVHEAWEVVVQLKDGRRLTGYPDSRQSQRGLLVLIARRADGGLEETPGVSIDDIADIRRI
jgi:hypothetical protein